jgi:tRNA threonylcarbamoyladenosine biosynthesis protein TsaE
MKIISNTVNDTLKIGKSLAKLLQKSDIICLLGDLGAGKTTLVKGIASELGVSRDEVVSPTFVLIREYDDLALPLYHFDLYRLNDPSDILGLGYDEYFYGQGVSVIEWADKLGYLLPKEYLRIELYIKNDSQRLLKIEACGRRYEGLLKNFHENHRY